MKKLKLFTKTIIPTLIFGIVFSYIGFLYLNSVLEHIINEGLEQKLETKIEIVANKLKSEFRLIFYLHGTSIDDFNAQEKIEQKDIINILTAHINQTKDIAYIYTSNKYIPLSNNTLSKTQMTTIQNNKIDTITINNSQYKIKTYYFKPWDWEIVYLLNVTDFKNILIKNKIVLFGTVFALLFVLMLTIGSIYKVNIKNPINILLAHFKSIAQGKYHTIKQIYNTIEIDDLIENVNNMTKSVKDREEEAKQLLELTKQSEEYLKDILSSQSSMIIVNDMVEILDVNDSFLNFFSDYKTLDEFKSKHQCICDFFVEEEGFIYKFKDKNWVEYILANPQMLHKVKIKKDNKYFIFAIQAKEFKKHDRIIITMIDITELEKSTNLVEQYKKAVDASAIVSKTDLKGKITYANEKFIDISGYTKEELLGANHNIVRSENTPSEVFKEMWDTIQKQQIWHGEIENRRKDGSKYYVAATIVPILDENHNTFEYMALRFDITQQVLEKQKAQKAENAKSNFLANMSHEIRTPLNAIIGFTKLLTDSEMGEKEKKYINIIDQSANNLLGIINDILDLSKIENGSLKYEQIEFNPFTEFESVANLFMANANKKSISFVPFIDPKIPQTIIGDPLRIKQVVSNLVSNAIKFTPKNGTVFLRIELLEKRPKKALLRVSVQDSGIGIPKEKQKLIFEEFSQADNSVSREFGGTGLGLSISNKIVQLFGSHIKLESEEGKGSKFYFDIEFDTDEKTHTHLEEFKKLHVAIIKSTTVDIYQFDVLKEYLESLCTLSVIEDTSQTDDILKQNIVFINENDVDENIKQIKESEPQFIVLSEHKVKCEDVQNGIILNIPLHASALFDILVGFIDHEALIKQEHKDDCATYNGSILIAEDHEINQQLIAALLDLRGLKYTFANNGNEAVELFKKGKYDLILMDINMPEKNGIEATIEIIATEKEQNLPHTPIVALTANVIEADRQKIMDVGTDDYLYKPIDERRLDEVFAKYLKIQNVKQDINVNYDLQDASKKMNIPPEIAKKIVANFCMTIESDLQNLKDAIDEQDFEKIKSFSHKIKGVALNLRMEKVAEFAYNIEKLVIDKSTSLLEDNFSNLIKAVDAVKKSIE